jgi:methylmalonyl-CoA mutase cobalamin-binding domain/chain
MKSPIRILTAVPICDGHDSAINTINLELIRHGVEVVYLGYHRSARDIVRAAIQEDVRAIGISSYNGGHVEFFAEVVDLLHKHRAGEIGVFGGGGGTITHEDARTMQKKGVDRIFFAGTPLQEIVDYILDVYDKPRKRPELGRIRDGLHSERQISVLLTTAIEDMKGRISEISNSKFEIRPLTIGFTGPGGVGKTTLIDELVRRHLKKQPRSRIAILSHDPSVVGRGALLGDRASMIYSQDDRVFMRSLASRGQAGGVAKGTDRCLQVLKHVKPHGHRREFDLILVETVGIGQEAIPFQKNWVDQTVMVLGPDYGSRLQLQKIAMLDVANLVVVNKSDLPGARTASSEVEHRISLNDRSQKMISTVAKHHRDTGVDELYQVLCEAS